MTTFSGDIVLVRIWRAQPSPVLRIHDFLWYAAYIPSTVAFGLIFHDPRCRHCTRVAPMRLGTIASHVSGYADNCTVMMIPVMRREGICLCVCFTAVIVCLCYDPPPITLGLRLIA